MENNYDDLVIHSILEKLEKIEVLINNEQKPFPLELFKNISEKSFMIDGKIDFLSKQFINYPSHDYTNELDDIDNSIDKFKTDLEKHARLIELSKKERNSGIIIIGSLALLLMTSIFFNVQCYNSLNSSKANDIKYRYMRSLGNHEMVKSTLSTDSIFRQSEFSEFKTLVERREELIRQKIEAELRLKEKEQETFKLRDEAERLKNLTK